MHIVHKYIQCVCSLRFNCIPRHIMFSALATQTGNTSDYFGVIAILETGVIIRVV